MKQEENENSEAAENSRQKRLGFKRTENRSFCLLCERQVELLTYERSAKILKTDNKEILELAETGQIHRLHNARGEIVICAESLFDVLKKRPTERFDIDIFKTNPSGSNILF